MVSDSTGTTKVARQHTDGRLVEMLSNSDLYRTYRDAFENATGLPLGLRMLDDHRHSFGTHPKSNEFCLLMANSSRSCKACLELQAKLEKEALLEPKTLRCFAGLCETAVPVRVSGRTLAFLQTGQIFLIQPNKQLFSRMTERLLSWGSDVDLKSLEESFFQTKVMDSKQYHAFVGLLATFAGHLELLANNLAIHSRFKESETINQAKYYIEDHYQNPIPLDTVAKVVNTSTSYFCKLFKEATGLTFIDYLSRIRVEKAKSLLQNSNLRVTEIACDAGFESLSQFNRAFKRITGITPLRFRKQLSDQQKKLNVKKSIQNTAC